MSSVSPGGADLVPTTPDWPAWVGFMVTTHFDLVSGPFHSPNFIGLHSVSTSANMYHLNPRAGELPHSASSHFILYQHWHCDKFQYSVALPVPSVEIRAMWRFLELRKCVTTLLPPNTKSSLDQYGLLTSRNLFMEIGCGSTCFSVDCRMP